ncbi:DUF2857 domain-containing protein [Citrobacter amalonaticus]|uniref:DUF2857 domain-containing protein n=1 Tax=Citrobacter amalonaticus TaxID=35703 RepID=UPI001A29D86A|nr:DUF2857 domain-containing protein [Citrobacter amalonaticus]HDQ2811387.1 DUF2857 domain-containing protein [Citrobacter amalonaticus]
MIPPLNYVILTHALHALKNGDIHYCETIGFTHEEIRHLSRLTLDELFFITRASVPLLDITVRHDHLSQCLLLSRQEIQRQQQIDRAIRLGGSIALLSAYFGLTSNDTCLRRRLNGITVTHGRSPLPDETTDARIWQLWHKFHPGSTDTLNALDVMMQITESVSFGKTEPVSLTTVWNRITRCEQEKLDRRATHAG